VANNRPAGITLLAVAFILLGLLSLFWSLLVFGVSAAASVTGAIVGAENMAAFGGANAWQGVVGVVGAVIDFIVAFGLLGLRRWAWVLALVGVGANVVLGVMGLFSGGFFAFCCGVLGLVLPGAILYYLLRPDVRRAFER
jgi:hypothetical protein